MRSKAAVLLVAVCVLLPVSAHLWLENSRLVSLASAADDPPPAETAPARVAPIARACPAAAARPATPPPADLEQLKAELEAVESELATVRVVRRMGGLGAEAIGALTDLLGDDRHRVAMAAAEALGEIGGLGAVGPLEDSLYRSDWTRVSVGAIGLAAVDTPLALSVLIRGLNDPRTSGYRAPIIEALGGIARDDAVGALTQALHEGVDQTPKYAAGALARSRAGRVVLLDAAEAHNPIAVRRAALEALAPRREPDIDGLFDRILSDAESPVRAQAIEALGHRPGPATLRLLQGFIASGASPDRQAAARALAEIDTPAATGVLANAIRTARNADQSTFIYTLGQMHNPASVVAIRALLMSPDPNLHRVAAGAVSWDRPHILAELDPATVPAGIRGQVYHALMRVDPESALPVVEAAVRAGGSSAVEALTALARCPNEAARGLLVESVESADSDMAQAALTAIGGFDGLPVDARERLVSRIAQGEVSPKTLWSLGDTRGSPELRDALVAAIRDGEGQVRDAAAHALSMAGMPATSQTLSQLLDEPDLTSDVRGAAINAIAGSGEAAATPILTKIARSGDATAIAALSNVDQPGAVATLVDLSSNEDAATSSAAFSALVNCQRPEATQALITTVGGDPARAEQAIYGLSGREDPAARKAVLDAAWGDHPAAVRAAALGTLSYGVEDDQAYPVLEHALDDSDPNVVSAAMQAIEYRTGGRSTDLLLSVMHSDFDDDLRRRAARAIESRGGVAARENADLIKELTDAPEAQLLIDGWESPFELIIV